MAATKSPIRGNGTSRIDLGWRVRGAGATIALALALVTTSCTGGAKGTVTTSSGGTPVNGGVASLAELPSNAPNYIFPLTPIADYGVYTIYQFQQLMYRPLYLFGADGRPEVSEGISLAYPPRFTHGDTQVTIRLKRSQWSDGTPVTATDIVFWEHLVTAEKDNWGGYVPGEYPDNIRSIHVDNPSTVTLVLTQPYAPRWFWYDQLSQITPLPPAWDKTSESAAPGSGRCASNIKFCPAVYRFLTANARTESTYATNPLWQVVDGPWRLKSFNSNGDITFVPNHRYIGPDKPHLAEFKEVGFTSSVSEMDVLRSGSSISVGYLPIEDAPPKPADHPVGANPLSARYNLRVWYWWGFEMILFNFNNASVGPIFRQLYIRQALQHLIDQQTVISGAIRGYGIHEYGPVNDLPSNPYYSSSERGASYPFDVKTARNLLRDHGWSVRPNGTTTCVQPGTGPGHCGSGITKGEALRFNLQYADLSHEFSQEMQALESNASEVGIRITLRAAPFPTVVADTVPCHPKQPLCSWELSDYTGDNYLAVPTGAQEFQTNGAFNAGSYSNKTMDKLIYQTVHHYSAAAMSRYEAYAARQLPVLYEPMDIEQLSEVATNLRGVTPQDPLFSIFPERWYWVK